MGYKGKTYLIKDEEGNRDTNMTINCNMSQYLFNIHDSILVDTGSRSFSNPHRSREGNVHRVTYGQNSLQNQHKLTLTALIRYKNFI
jgi:hypothetical protein